MKKKNLRLIQPPIHLAVSDSPGGPFTRVKDNPILKVSVELEKFDNYRVDDTAMLHRNGICWLSRMHGSAGPGRTRMGVAFSGPFTKYDKPLLDGSHEVLIWKQGDGVGALATLNDAWYMHMTA